MEKYLKTPFFVAAGIGFMVGVGAAVMSSKLYNFVAGHLGASPISAQ